MTARGGKNITWATVVTLIFLIAGFALNHVFASKSQVERLEEREANHYGETKERMTRIEQGVDNLQSAFGITPPPKHSASQRR